MASDPAPTPLDPSAFVPLDPDETDDEFYKPDYGGLTRRMHARASLPKLYDDITHHWCYEEDADGIRLKGYALETYGLRTPRQSRGDYRFNTQQGASYDRLFHQKYRWLIRAACCFVRGNHYYAYESM
jgi:hypothetical protein